MNTKIKTLIAAASLVFAIGGAASSASAADWQHHPRRAEVNTRLERQNLRIERARRMHVLTAYEARRLHMADQRVRAQERALARRHGGHLTRVEQMRLERQENAISHRIG
jgi:hypothetical protein